MDLLKDATKNLSLYEVKAYVRKAQNVAMNLTEMEAKVREATNNEPWGCPTTLMAQIAGGTYNYREREEIIGFIFRRFTEKAANEWRQIYKSLQLLEYLIKNGSERLIDDVRANVSLIQMLKSFHYIDSKGRDQGINVRNRAKNLVNLLNDDSLIRSERKKARANQKKFGGVSSAAYGGASSVIGNGSGYDDGDFTNRVYGDGGVYGERYDDPAAAYNGDSNDQFEEYDVGGSSNGASKPTTESSRVHAKGSASKSKPQPEKPKQPEQDLLGDLLSFDNSTAASGSVPAYAPAVANNEEDDDDEFDDFQAAPSQPQKPALSNLSNLYQPPQPHQQFASTNQPSFSAPINNTANYSVNSSISASSGPAKPAASNDAFSSLFSSAKTKTKSSAVSTPTQPAATKTQTQSQSQDNDFFGDFSTNNNNNSKPANNSSNNGEMDLLSF